MSGSRRNKRGYIGVGIDDTTTGLTHIGAREYDQNSGRFISADPIIDIADPLQMNGYAYSNNSPVSYSDPTGLCLTCGEGYPIGGTVSNGTKKRYVGASQGASQGGGGVGEPSRTPEAEWVRAQTPRSNDIQDLLKHFTMNSPNGDSPHDDYWITPVYENSGEANA